MKLAVLTISYPNLSETFVSREVDALAALGHGVTVCTMRDPSPMLTPSTTLPVRRWTDAAVADAAPEVLYGSLGFPAHERTIELARRFHLPFVLRIWEGYDAFTHPNPDFYRAAQADPRCLGMVVEDEWMRKYAREKMGLDPARVTVIPNGVDTETFQPMSRPSEAPPVVLAVARFVEKKGLGVLIAAFKALHPTAVLRLVGYGPLERDLREAASGCERIDILPPVSNEDLPALYHAADVFAAPCVQVKSGDADGVPTTVIEAMACGLPVVMSELLSARRYVEHGTTGLLVAPGNEQELAQALSRLCDEAELRRTLGSNARAVACKAFSLATTVGALEALLQSGSRQARWKAGCEHIQAARAAGRPKRAARYEDIANRFVALAQIGGRVLDVGCGDGSMRHRLNGQLLSYSGVDPHPLAVPEPWFTRAEAEWLPYADAQFDTVLSYSVLQHVIDPATALREAHRVLCAGGRLALQVVIDEANPRFLWWWSRPELIGLVERAGFTVECAEVIDEHYLVVAGRK